MRLKLNGKGVVLQQTWSCEQDLMYRPHEVAVMQHWGVIK